MAAKDIDTNTTFQSTRALLDETITELFECLEGKRDELATLIDLIETDYNDKHSEIVSDIDKLDTLKKQTETLAKNSLSELQQKLIEDITLKITNLQIESKLSPQIKLSFDKNIIIAAINGMNVVGYECVGLKFESVKDKKVKKEWRGRGKGKGRKVKGDICEIASVNPECNIIPEEVSDKKKKKLKIEKKHSLGEELAVDETGKHEPGKKEKKEDKQKKGSTGEPVPPQGKKGKNKGKGGTSSFDAHALIESAEFTESL